MSSTHDEFAEFDTDETTFDAMLDDAEPAELIAAPARVTVTVGEGVPVTLGDSVLTSAGRRRLDGQARRRHAIRHDAPSERVAS